jgi:hypothetical protein
MFFRFFLFIASFWAPHALAETLFGLNVELTGDFGDVSGVNVQLFVDWGAGFSPNDRPPGTPQFINQTLADPDSNISNDLRRETHRASEDTISIIVWGVVKDSADNTTIGYIPVEAFFIEDFDNVDQMTLPVTLAVSPQDIFLASYPFKALSDVGFMNDQNVRTVLVAARRLIEMYDQYQLTLDEGYQRRFETFFLRNQKYFVEGDPRIILDIMNFMSAAGNASTAIPLDPFRAEFHTSLLTLENRSIGGQGLHEQAIEALESLYALDLSSSAKFANLSLQGLEAINRFDDCVELSRVILQSVDQEFVQQHSEYVRPLLVQSSRCGSLLFEQKTGDSRINTTGAAQYLQNTPEGREMMNQYVRVFKLLDYLGLISVADDPSVENIINVLFSYRKALQ